MPKRTLSINILRLITFLFIFTYAAQSAALDFTKTEKYAFDSSRKYGTRSLLIIQNGKTILKKSKPANEAEFKRPRRLWSMTKSIAALLIGRAEKLGYLHRNDRVDKYFKEGISKELGKIKISNLLEMSSGLKWNELYESSPIKSDVVKMLYLEGYKKMVSYVAAKESEFPPGQNFKYSSGETNLLFGVLRKALGDKVYSRFPWSELFTKLGITSATWERDLNKNFIASSYLYLSVEDLAKIGQLMLNNGSWNGEQLLPKDWVKYSSTPNQAFKKTYADKPESRSSYGAQWWLNADINQIRLKRPYPEAPSDMIMAFGHHGQILAISKSQNFIMVRLGLDKKEKINRKRLFKLIFEDIAQEN